MGAEKRKRMIKGAFVAVLLFSVVPVRGEIPAQSAVAAEICQALERGSGSFRIGSRTETTEAGEDLLRFYTQNRCRPVWSEANTVDPQALYLINVISKAGDDGLEAADSSYNLAALLSLMNSVKTDPSAKNTPAVLAQLDILLSDAYMMLGKDLYSGAVPRGEVRERWGGAVKKPLDISLRLGQALQNNTLSQSLEQLSPRQSGYYALKKLLQRYLGIQKNGGWKRIESFTTDPQEVERYFADDLKARLRAEGDLSEDDDTPEGFRAAVTGFQQRHGIRSDGKIGGETLSALNIPVEEKIAAIRLNMERWRWMPENADDPYIAVNIPDFSLSVIDNSQTVLRMKAIVGRPTRPTPVFDARMTYIVLNPYWRVPATILREDIFPKVRKDIRYLKKERIRIFRHSDPKGVHPINPYSINWKKADPNRFPYYLRQDAGKKNALGRLKFMFPNTHDVYIHDTPDRHLFEKTLRSFSSGCIRVQEPLKLADYLLARDGSGRRIAHLIGRGVDKPLSLSRPVKVFIDYRTVWEDEEGTAHFRSDVYGYDRELAAIMGWDDDLR